MNDCLLKMGNQSIYLDKFTPKPVTIFTKVILCNHKANLNLYLYFGKLSAKPTFISDAFMLTEIKENHSIEICEFQSHFTFFLVYFFLEKIFTKLLTLYMTP